MEKGRRGSHNFCNGGQQAAAWLKGNGGTSEGEKEKPGGAGKACPGFWRVSERKVEKGEVRFRKAGWLGSVAMKGGSVSS